MVMPAFIRIVSFLVLNINPFLCVLGIKENLLNAFNLVDIVQ